MSGSTLDAPDEYMIDKELLIYLVQKRPVLWDKSLELYKNRVATQEAWREIMTELDPALATMKKKKRQYYGKLILRKWTHIRDSYHRNLKKIEEQKISGNKINVKPYLYSKQLAFLKKVLHPYVRKISYDSDVSSHEGTCKEEVVNTEDDAIESSDEEDVKPKLCVPQKPVHAVARTTESFSSQLPTENNRFLSFFNGILPSLDDLDDNETLDFQMGVLQVLKNIRGNRANC